MIRHFKRCIVINISFFLPPCHAMQPTFIKSQPTTILSTITTQGLAQSIQFLHNNIFVTVEKNKCYIYDSVKNSLINTLKYDTEIIHTATEKHQKLLAICSKKNNTSTIELYNTLTHQIIWKQTAKNCHNQPFFSSINNDAIFLFDEKTLALHSFNYKNNAQISYPLPLDTPKARHFIANPIKSEFILFAANNDDIIVLQYNKDKNVIFNKKTCTTMDWKSGETIDGQYNFDGSMIACYHTFLGLFTMNLNDYSINLLKNCIKRRTKFCAMRFHPTSFILAVFSIPVLLLNSHPVNACITYWNTKEGKPISIRNLTINPDDISFHTYKLSPDQCIDFFSDDTQLFVALNKRCLVTEIPSNVRCFLDAKNKCISLLWCLNNYTITNSQLPKELKYGLAHLLFDICEC